MSNFSVFAKYITTLKIENKGNGLVSTDLTSLAGTDI